MKLNRFISDEEYHRILEISKREDLISDNKRFYYHAERMEGDEDVIFMNTLLEEVIEGFVSFSNFTLANPHNIRIQYEWGPTFTGVGWVSIDELKHGFSGNGGLDVAD